MPRYSTLISGSTLRVAGAVAVLAVTAPFASPSSAAEGIEELRCSKDRVYDGKSTKWQSFPGPRFDAGLGIDAVTQQITSYSVSPANSKRIAVTNGNSVYVSMDGGCDWSLSFRLDQVPSDPSIPLSGSFTTIKFVHVTASGAVFAVAEELETGAAGANVARPRVLRSRTGAIDSWQLAEEGLPPIGTPLAIRSHRTNGNVLYITFSGAREESQCPPAPLPCGDAQQGQELGLMYGTTNAGTSWGSRTDPNDLDSVSAIRYFSIDDDDAQGNIVWVVANGTLQRSDNGGRTFQPPDGLPQAGFRFTAVETLANIPKSRGLKVLAFSDDQEMIRLDGNRWIRSRAPFGSAVESIAQRPEGDIAVATRPVNSAPAQVWRIYPEDFRDFDIGKGVGGEVFKQTHGWEFITPPVGGMNVPASAQAGAGSGAAGTYYVQTKDRLVRFLGSKVRLPETSAPPTTVGPPPVPRGTISPNGQTHEIAVGKTKTVQYTLTLPPSPTPIDVYLLIDNSVSMKPTIEGLKANLGRVAQRLHDSGVDIAMGVGKINVEPQDDDLPIDDDRTEHIDESRPQPLYERLRAIGPVDPDLFEQLSTIDGNGGSGKEAQLEALYQAVTGAGLSYNNLGWLIGYDVKKGQQAGFRDALDPIKVIVHATDEEFTTDLTKGHNDFESVARALNDAGVKQVGLSQGVDEATVDLKRMAELTKSLAPPGGTDCDGDGVIGYNDVRAGQPLVCGESEGLDATLVNLISSLSDRQVIQLGHNRAPTIGAVSALSFAVDAKETISKKFTVTYSCKGLQPGPYVNDFTASLRGLTIAKMSANVNCGGLAIPAPPQVAVEPAVNPPPPQPQPIVPAPVPVNPVPQPQAQPQVQTQVQPQAGMADQEEEAFELALAHNEMAQERQEGDQIAMTGLSYVDHPEVVLALGMTLTTAVGVGYAVRRRSRTAAARVTVRR